MSNRTKPYDVFLPIVTVSHDGHIDIDFSDSYDHTEVPDEQGGSRSVHWSDAHPEHDYQPGSAILDTLVPTGENGLSLPESLRRLADYIEAQR